MKVTRPRPRQPLRARLDALCERLNDILLALALILAASTAALMVAREAGRDLPALAAAADDER